jgi:hypothetical protein
VLLYPLFGRRVAGAWAASILMDVDHYAWFAVNERSLNPVEAFGYFDEANPPQHQATRILHSPVALAAVFALGAWNRRLMPIAIGMAAHAGLDVYHRARVQRSKRINLRREGYLCRNCGEQGPHVVAHLAWQPRLLPSYRPENFIALCPGCHDAAHAEIARASRPPVLRAVPALLLAMWRAVS